MLEQHGYYYHPHYYSFPLGHPQLDFDLLPQPGGRSFNLKLAHIRIWEHENFSPKTLSHLVRQPGKLQVFPGRFWLEAFDGQAIYGFCFGGELQIIHFPDFTRFHLTSPAPIGNLSDKPESPQVMIINELATMVARERAGMQNDDFLAHKLANVDPFQLFVASLAALDARAKKLAATVKTQQYRQMAGQVGKAIQAVKEAGAWPDSVPTLDEMLR